MTGQRGYGLTLVELLAALVILSSVAAAGASIMTGSRSAAQHAVDQFTAEDVLASLDADLDTLQEFPRIVRDASGQLWRVSVQRGPEVEDVSEIAALSGYRWVQIELARSDGEGRFETVTSALRLVAIEEVAP